ncbi:MAG: hypothetical protein AMK71_09555 [Nitrospira bacterium SG8_35_4]|nr:MAG: hypothetical protein AMK71_09555 [Nitrospira bacterium SG8_35_4]
MSYKEKRSSERISCSLDATIISDAKIYEGFIKNVSESGLAYSSTSGITLRKGDPVKNVRLIFSVFSDEVIGLNCIPRWYATDGTEDHIVTGMKIIDPPPRYNELIRNIHLCKYL